MKEVIYPFTSPEFMEAWNLWKQYKKEQFRFTYKSVITEQAALKALSEVANCDTKAIQIIHQSISNGWRGLFPLKQQPKQNAAQYFFEQAQSGNDPFRR